MWGIAYYFCFVFRLVWANKSYTKIVDMLHNNWCIIKLVLTVDSGENDVIPVKTNYVSCKKYCDHSDIASLYLNSHNFISFASFCLLFY